MNHGEQKYPGFPMNQMPNQKMISQYQQQIQRLQNAQQIPGMPQVPQMPQMRQPQQQQQQQLMQQHMNARQQMMQQPGQFPFQNPNLMKYAQSMLEHSQGQGMPPPMQGMGQMPPQIPGQFMAPNSGQGMQNPSRAPNSQNTQQVTQQQSPLMPGGMDQGMPTMGQPGSQPMTQNEQKRMSKSVSNQSLANMQGQGTSSSQDVQASQVPPVPPGPGIPGMPGSQVPPGMMPGQNFGMTYNMPNAQFPMQFSMQQLSASGSSTQLLPPGMGPQHQKKNKNAGMPKRRNKKHLAQSDAQDSPMEVSTPQPPPMQEISVIPPNQVAPNDANLIKMALNTLTEEKYDPFFRVFGCILKRKEVTIDNFISFFAAHCYKTLPNAIKFVTDLAHEFKLNTDVYKLLMNPPCPQFMTPLKTYKIQYQIVQCCPKGAEFTLLGTAKKGESIAYGVFISLFEEMQPVPIYADREEIHPVNFGDTGTYYPIQSHNKQKVTIKFTQATGTQIKWFVLMYANKRTPMEVLHVLMERANIPFQDADKLYAHTLQCPGCQFNPQKIIEQALNGSATCPNCGAPIIINDLILVKKQCMSKNQLQLSPQQTGQGSQAMTPMMPNMVPAGPMSQQQPPQAPQPQSQPPHPERVEENPEQEKLITLLADQIAVCVRPKPESSGWTKAVDAKPITAEKSTKKFSSQTIDELEKSFDDCDDYFV